MLSLMSLLPPQTSAGVIKGKIECKGVKDNRDVIVYLEQTPDSAYASPKKNPVMDQKDLTFIPHVLPILKGTTVEFHNSDDVLHNVFTPDKCAEKMNLGTWPKNQSKSYTFENLGCESVILCNVHPEMEAWVVVLQNPFYAKTDKDGTFEIKDVPPGKYNLAVWHEKLKAPSVEIDVPATGAVEINFTLKK